MDAAKANEKATLIPLASMETHVSGEITGQGQMMFLARNITKK